MKPKTFREYYPLPTPPPPPPLIRSVDYTFKVLIVYFNDDIRVLNLSWFPELVNASSSELNNWKVLEGGVCVVWPDLKIKLFANEIRYANGANTNFVHSYSTSS